MFPPTVYKLHISYFATSLSTFLDDNHPNWGAFSSFLHAKIEEKA
jgi:hypothetical protein